MAEIVLYIAVSLDGFIATGDGGVDWLSIVDDEQEDYGYAQFYGSIDALLMGSHTYQQILGFGDWPYPGKQSYVMTSQALACERQDVRLISNDVKGAVDYIKAQQHQRIWLVGGGQLASSFHRHKLIDEYQLFIIPVTLGEGIPLFTGQQAMQQLDLKYSKSYPKGVLELRYQRKS